MISIVNNGPAILSTSYWSTEHAKRGLLYLSINAATIRVLVPRATKHALDDLPPVGRAVTLTRSTWEGASTLVLQWDEQPGSGLEPYSIDVDARQCDRIPSAAEDGRVLPLVWYVPVVGYAQQVREVRREQVQLGEVVAS